MSEVLAIAGGPLALKLALTGMRVCEVDSAGEAEEALEAAIEGAAGAVVVEERFRCGFTASFLERLARHKGRPLVLYCPGFDGEDVAADTYAAMVLKPAVGYEIRLG